MDKPDRVSLIYIAASAERVWAALVDPEASQLYFFGHRVEVAGPVGTAFVIRKPDGAVDTEGEVLAWEPPHRLAVSWRVVWLDELKDLPPARVEYRIEPVGEVVRLTVTEYFGGPVPARFVEAGRQGWALILSGLKTLLETGRPLPPVRMEAPQ